MIHKTHSLFFNDHRIAIPDFDSSAKGWCQIPTSFIEYLEKANYSESITIFNSDDEAKFMNDLLSDSKFNEEIPHLLQTLISIYLKLQLDLTSTYSLESSDRVKLKINEFAIKLELEPHSLTNIPNIIEKISRDIKTAKRALKIQLKHTLPVQSREDKIELMNKLRKDGRYSVKEICEECNFSPTTYYLYSKRSDRNEWKYVKPRGSKYNSRSINEEEKAFIKQIADDPKYCYTVPEICNSLNNRFHRNISKGKVYRFLSKELKYTFKFNSHSAPPAFEPAQDVIRYKIAKKLIESYHNNITILFWDETGIDLSLSRLRSYSKRGTKPYRMRISKSQRLNILMSITMDNVFCYEAVKGSISELECIGFLISCISHIIKYSGKSLDKFLLVMDNYGSHRSLLMMKFLKLVKIPTLFTPIYYCFLNPIENLFAFIKNDIKGLPKNSMYF